MVPVHPDNRRKPMLGVIAKIKVKEGQQKEFEAVAKKLVAAVNANEPGCKLYALHRTEDPLLYVFMERYADQAAVDAHRGSDHFKTFGRERSEERRVGKERVSTCRSRWSRYH